MDNIIKFFRDGLEVFWPKSKKEDFQFKVGVGVKL